MGVVEGVKRNTLKWFGQEDEFGKKFNLCEITGFKRRVKVTWKI